MSGTGHQDYIAIRYRILANLKEQGPMTTQELLHTLKGTFSEEPIRLALRFLEGDGDIGRPSQHQKWILT